MLLFFFSLIFIVLSPVEKTLFSSEFVEEFRSQGKIPVSCYRVEDPERPRGDMTLYIIKEEDYEKFASGTYLAPGHYEIKENVDQATHHMNLFSSCKETKEITFSFAIQFGGELRTLEPIYYLDFEKKRSVIFHGKKYEMIPLYLKNTFNASFCEKNKEKSISQKGAQTKLETTERLCIPVGD